LVIIGVVAMLVGIKLRILENPRALSVTLKGSCGCQTLEILSE
jgi:hypothetical protein